MRNKPIYPRRVLCLPPDYAVWGCKPLPNYARCSPEDVVCLALREWVRLPHRVDFAAKSPALSLPAEIREKNRLERSKGQK